MTKPIKGKIVLQFVMGTLICAMPLFAQTEPKILIGGEAAKLFLYQGKPVHPFCLFFPFDSSRSDPLDLSKCTDNQVVPNSEGNGWLGAEYPRDAGRGSASYRVLAKKGDRFLVASTIWGGGSGQFSMLFWLHLDDKQLVIAAPGPVGGDRCAGNVVDDYAADGETFRYSISTTTGDIVALTGVTVDDAIKGKLDDTPSNCDGKAFYRYDLVSEKAELTSLVLNERGLSAESGPQSCFDGIVLQYFRKKKMTLSPVELKEFGSAFEAACTGPNAAKPGQPSPGAIAMQTLIDRHDYVKAGPDGTWLVDGVGTSLPWTVVLRANGPVLTGIVKTCSSTQMSLEIYDGRVDGNTIAFKCKSADGNRTISLTGRLTGDEIAFAWEKQVQGNNAFPRDGMFGDGAPPRFTAKRVRNAELSYAYPSPAAEALEKLLDSHDYLEIARTLPKAKGLTPEERQYFTGMLAYRQGRFDESVKALATAAIRTPDTSLTAFFIKMSLETLGDIAAKTYQYGRYAQMYDDVDKIFSARLGNLMGSAFGEKHDIADVLRIVPPQTIQISGDFSLKKTGDGMGEYPINIGGKNFSAGLDTGAIFSLLSESTAKSWGVTPLAGTVTFHGYSSDIFTAHPGLIPVLQMGKAELRNVVVFVTADKNLYFAEIKKQIHALLGYPVVSALGRLTFKKDGTLTVSAQSSNTTRDDEAALWVGDSTLLISLNTVPIVDKGKVTGGAEPHLFQLDTGSRDTIITDRYLAEHRDAYTGPPPDLARLAGSGGIRTIPAYSARNLPLAFGSTWVTLNGDHVLTESQGGEGEDYFGVIGQNLLQRFSSYTIDFHTLRFSIAP